MKKRPFYRDFVLHWRNVADYEDCPQKFLWSRGWETIDLGRGLGRGKEKPKDKSRHHAVMGIVIQAVIEDLYNEELWRKPEGVLAADHLRSLNVRLTKMTQAALSEEVMKNYINWRASPGQAEMEETCVSGVLGYLKTMARHKLLGPYARAEVELYTHIDQYNPICGYPDVIVTRDDETGITIIDGKNSQTKLKHVDADQLRWYALCFYLCHSKLPNRLGFVWYRYPFDGQGEEGVDWVDFTERDLQALVARAKDVRQSMNKEKFDPTPSSKACRWCDFESVCPARKEMAISNARPESSLPILDASDGFVEFDLGSDGVAQTASGQGK